VKRVKHTVMLVACLALGVLWTGPARAQFNGSHTLGDFGVKSGSQPEPGLYATFFYYRYDAGTLKDRGGHGVTLSPGSPSGSLGMNAYVPIIWYVSRLKILGAYYGAMAVVPWADGDLEAPALGVSEATGTRFADISIRPIDLGWHNKKADFSAGFQFYAPSGHYVDGGSDNTGKGMWTYEPFGGVTGYFDEKKTLSLATTAFWELHGAKKDSDVKVGQILTLEGGLAKSYLGGGVIIGAAYYAQWKATADDLGGVRSLPGVGTIGPELGDYKHRVFGLGPDAILPIATKKQLYALVNIRYQWEMGAETKTEGQTLTIAATFPIPSVKL